MSDLLNVIIGERDAGKTTILFKKYKAYLEKGKKILIIDSATEHVEKSLLIKVLSERRGCLNIPQCDKSKVIYPKICETMYPSYLVKNNSQVILCDTSYYLEKGYEYPVGEQREFYRQIYKRYAMQVISVFLSYVDLILLDEIELVQESKELLDRIKLESKELYMTLHKDDGLAGLQNLFKIERIKNEW